MTLAQSAVDTASVASFEQRFFRTRAEDTLPLTIQHQRIYILPTRRGLAFLLSLLLMLIASVNYALSLGYALCFLLTGLFAASLLHTYKNVAGITIKKVASQHAFVNEMISYSVIISNQTELDRVGIAIKSTTAEDTVDVSANEQSIANLACNTSARGMHSLGRLTVTSTFPIGLWRTWCYVHCDASTIIYPKPEVAAPPVPMQSLNESGENSERANHGDIDGLRDYVAGDALSSIAWKAAARGQGLYVKTFEQNSAGGKTTLSLETTGLVDVEQQLSRLCAWVLAAEQNQTHYAMNLPAAKLTPANGEAHRESALTALALHGIEHE